MLIAPSAPGLLFALWLTIADRTFSLQVFVAAGLLTAIGGAPIVFCVFASAVWPLSRWRRMSWLGLTITGYLSALLVGVVHCAVTRNLPAEFASAAIFALCGAVGGLAFWFLAGDIGDKIIAEIGDDAYGVVQRIPVAATP